MIGRYFAAFIALLVILGVFYFGGIKRQTAVKIQIPAPAPAVESYVSLPAATTTPNKNNPAVKVPESQPADKKKQPPQAIKPPALLPAPPKEIQPIILPPALPADLTGMAIYQALDTAVVQIVCDIGNSKFSSGSGVVVSAAGIVLTNEHVIHGGKDCLVKTGNPASSAGHFQVLYAGDISAKISDTIIPREDYALGRITTLTPRSLLTRPFKYLRLNTAYLPQTGDSYYAAAYASEFIGGGGIIAGIQNLVFTTTRLVSTYATDDASKNAEILELAGNISTQEGSSGSPIVLPQDGSVVGLVFGEDKTREPEGQPNTQNRTEFAFLISYLDTSIRAKKGVSLQDFISQLGSELSPAFAP